MFDYRRRTNRTTILLTGFYWVRLVIGSVWFDWLRREYVITLQPVNEIVQEWVTSGIESRLFTNVTVAFHNDQGHPTTAFCKISVRRSKNCPNVFIPCGKIIIFRWPFHSSTILFCGSLPNNFLRFSEVEFSHFSTYLKLFSFRRKRKPKIFVFENLIDGKSNEEKFSLSQNSKLHLKFSAK